MKNKIKEEIINIIKSFENILENVEISIPSSKENGDYSTNVAMKLASEIKKSPLDIANDIQSKFFLEEIDRIEVKKPGFINFFIKDNEKVNIINEIINKKENYGRSNIGKGKKINIEFVSANPTGIMHLGNARGGAYGDNLSRIMSFCGYEVNKEYYVNDLGNQVNNLGKSLQCRYLQALGIEKDMPEDGYFGKDIIEIGKILSDTYKDTLINSDLEFFKSYGIEKLIEGIKKDLKDYDIIHDEFTSEKHIYETGSIEKVLNILKEKDLIYKKEAATWFKATLFNAPRDFVIIKSDGKYTYLLPDIAHYMLNNAKGYDKLINVLGADHHGYVPGIKSGCQAVGIDPNIIEIKLLQLVKLLQNGEEIKMSKRSGKAYALKDLLEEVGLNATRYYFAARSLDTQMDFNIDLAKKKSNENPVYYVSYAYARICTILKENPIEEIIEKYETINSKEAYSILEKLSMFENIVEEASNKETPHIITNYVYDLASDFHKYYSTHRIITDNKRETLENINFIKAIKIVLYNSLNLIGVNPPEKM